MMTLSWLESPIYWMKKKPKHWSFNLWQNILLKPFYQIFNETFFYFQDIEKQEGYQAWIIGIVEKGQRTARIIDKPRVIEVPAKEKEGELW